MKFQQTGVMNMLKGLGGARVGKLFSLLLAVCIVFVMVACNQQSGPSSSASSPIKIGLTISKTGDFSQDGAALLQGYQIWADYVNSHGGLFYNRKVQLDILNDNSTSTQAITDYQKLINVNHDDLILGPYSSSLTLSV